MRDEERPPRHRIWLRFEAILPWIIFIGIFTLWGGSLYFWGDYKDSNARFELRSEMDEIKRERDNALSEAKTIGLSLNYQQEKNIDLEQENRELRDSNRDLRDSVASLSEEISYYETRIIEISEYGVGEVFDSQFLIKLENIRSDSLDEFIHYRAQVSFFYIGDKPELLNENPNGTFDDRDGSFYTNSGDAFSIKHGKMWYTVRLLYYDVAEKTATFSQSILSKEPTIR